MGIGGVCEPAGILELANVVHDRVEVGLRSDQSHASAPRPSPLRPRALAIVGLPGVERTTRPGLKLLHDLSGREIRTRHHGVDVLRAAVDGMEAPTPKTAGRCDGDFDGAAFRIRQRDARRLQTPGDRSPEAVLWSPLATTRIGPAARVARKPRSVGCPCEEERQHIGADDRSGFGSHGVCVRTYTHRCQVDVNAELAAIGALTRLRFLRVGLRKPNRVSDGDRR
jgi:hypothetical protein